MAHHKPTQSMSGPEMGYRVGNLSQVDARYKCCHCRLILCDPMQGDCGHRYCRNCVQLVFSEASRAGKESLCGACDPGERIEISPGHTYPDNAMRREINNITVQCPNSPCQQAMLLKDLAEHVNAACPFKPKPCDLCGDAVPAAALPEHKGRACRRRLEPCDVCKEAVAVEDLAEHKRTTCVGNTVQCEFCLARVKDDPEKQEMGRHLKSECPVGWHDKSPCPYGCSEMPEGWREHRRLCQARHVDRLMARSRQQLLESGGSAKPNEIPAASGTAVVALPNQDFEELRSLKERADALDKRLVDARLPAVSHLSGGFGDQAAARKHLSELQVALSQGDQLNELLTVIREEFENCHDKLRQHELRMQKDLEKKLDLERKHQELVKLLAYKEMKILDLERRVEILEHAGYDGVLVWKITDVRRRREEAREGKVSSFYSPPFYTSKAGYKMCGRLYLNGDGAGKNTHLSLYFVIMRGGYDALLPWPFAKKVTMMLLDQNFNENVVDAFKPDKDSSSFKRPVTDMNIASGCPLFMKLSDLESGARGYVKDDTMFIKFTVDKNDLPNN